ncbi:MAG: TGS domain-containing protein [Anaerolineae bacterium]|nr:TGS domain-containing protein [Anaerolineae bacterium]
MPTNLPPDYFEVEKEYRAAKTPEEKIACLEEMLSIVPKHKGTDHLVGDLRRRLAKLRTAPRSKKGSGRRSAFHIDKEGAGQVALVGAANTGKSALVAALTHATPEVSAAPYSTWVPTPGMMPINDIQVQLIDTPSLNVDYVEPELYNLIRHVDLVLVVVDLQAYPIQQLEDTVALLEEQLIIPAHRADRYVEQRRLVFLPTLVLANKADSEQSDGDVEVLVELFGEAWSILPVSATTGRNLEALKQLVFERLEIIRIYAKPPGKPPDLSTPFVMGRGSTVHEFAVSIHRDFETGLKSARVWGSVAHDGQMVGRDHVLQDGDVVELHIDH